MGLLELQKIRQERDMPKPKKIYKIAPKSKKRIEREKQERELCGDSELDKWFEARRKELVNCCQCGCGQKTSKNDNDFYRASISHVFPKSIFKSVATHPHNFVERNFWMGCHTNMDSRGLDKWPMFADWYNIKEIFHELAPLLTDEERANKFYSTLEKLVYDN